MGWPSVSKLPPAIVVVMLLLQGACSHPPPARSTPYPGHWWTPLAAGEKASWEIGPGEAGAGQVILSKRNELGLLSNFARTPFVLDGQRFASVEGFWQMMKYPENEDDPRAQLPLAWTREAVAQMVGFDAKRAGKAAAEAQRNAGKPWISYRGKRLWYKHADAHIHYGLIRRAMEAKVSQNPRVRRVLMATLGLQLLPDHHQSPQKTRAYEYHRIWMEIRAEEWEKETNTVDKMLSLWTDDARRRIQKAVSMAGAHETPIAVFDADGTLWHADIPREYLVHAIHGRRLFHFEYREGQHAEDRVAELYATCRHDVSICISQAAYLHAGRSMQSLETDMASFFQEFRSKTFPAQRQLIAYLRLRGFHIYVVTGGPQWLAQFAAAQQYNIPPERVIGVRTRLVDGVIGSEVIPPIPFRQGKAKAIHKHLQATPHIVVGNSASDAPMLATAEHLSIAVQSFGPDHKGFHYRTEQKLATIAQKNGWLIQTLVPGQASLPQ